MKTKPLIPRESSPLLTPLARRSEKELTAKERAVVEAEYRRLDREFAELFSPDAMLELYDRLRGTLLAHGWNTFHGTRNGVDLYSVDAFEQDRTAVAAADALDRQEELAQYVAKADPAQLRALRVAFQAGAAAIEAKAYRLKALGRGRTKIAPDIYRGLDAALARWRRKNPGAKREPTAAELHAEYNGPPLHERNRNNRVSEWRRLQENRS